MYSSPPVSFSYHSFDYDYDVEGDDAYFGCIIDKITSYKTIEVDNRYAPFGDDLHKNVSPETILRFCNRCSHIRIESHKRIVYLYPTDAKEKVIRVYF